MPIEGEEPLPIGIWLSGLRKLAESTANDNGDAEDRAVRQAFHFSKLSPLPISRIWKPLVSEDEMEALLEQGKVQQAASEVIGGDTAIELSSVSSPLSSRWTIASSRFSASSNDSSFMAS